MSDSERLPALCRGLAVVTAPSGVVIEGGPHRILLGGDAAKEFVPRLLPLLDGEHPMAEACAKLSVEPARVRQALRLLADWGVVEDAHAAGDLPEESAVFYSRLVATMGGYRGTGELLGELAGGRVLLAAGGDEELGRLLREDLTAGGVGTVEEAGDPLGSSLAVVLDGPGQPGVLDSLVRAANAGGVPVLRIAYAADAVEAGPLFWSADTSCVACFRRDYDASGMALARGGGGARGLLAGLATMEVLAVLARTTAVASLNTLVRTSLSGYATERYLFAPDGGCGGEPEEADEPEETARLIDAYEWHQALPPPRLGPAPRALVPEQRQLQSLLKKRTRRMTVPARRLPPEPELPPLSGGWPPDGEAVGEPGTAPVGPVGPAELAGLITRTAGLRGAGTDRARIRRWAPSGGGLGSVELYVVTESDPFGLPGTVFAYDDIGHRMLSVRSDTVPLKSALESTGLDAAEVGAAIVLVATVGRLDPKYGNFSWRLAHLDAGFTAMHLAAAAQGYGMRVSFAPSWADDLAGVLELDPVCESVAAVAGVVGTARGEDA